MASARRKCHWTRHIWRMIGPAPDFEGMTCQTWRCEVCGDRRELFEAAHGWSLQASDVPARDLWFSAGNDKLWGVGNWVKCYGPQCRDSFGLPTFHHKDAHDGVVYDD